VTRGRDITKAPRRSACDGCSPQQRGTFAVEPWHYFLPGGAYPPARGPVWVKADMIATIALARLDRVKMRGADGSSVYQVFRLGPDAMRAIGLAVKAALNLP
jgi:hypothetical protein